MKTTKCQVRGCKERACGWFNKKYVCQKHFYKLKVEKGLPPKRIPNWLVELYGRGR